MYIPHGVISDIHAPREVNTPYHHLSSMSFQHAQHLIDVVVVCLHKEGDLIVCSRWEPRSHRTGTRWIWVVNSVFMALLITNSNTILEVRNDSCHFVLVWLLVFSSPLGILSLHCYHSLLIVNSAPSITMSRERGKITQGMTYYSFMVIQHRTIPSSAPIMPHLSDLSLVGSSMDNLPHVDQNWMEED